MANSPIRIGYSISATGRFAGRAAPWYANAYKLWAGEVNGRGGILESPVELFAYDDESDPAKAAANYLRLIEEDGLKILLGPCHTALMRPILPVIDRHKALFLQGTHGSAAEFEKGSGWHFLCWPGCDFDYPRPYVEMIAGKASSAALVYTDGRIGEAVAAGVRHYLSAHHIDLVLDDAISGEPFDYGALMARAKASGADALLIGLDHGRKDEPRVSCLKAAHEAGIAADTIWHSDFPSPADRELGAANEGVHMRITWHPDMPYPQSQSFAAAYQAAYGEAAEFHCAGGYACGEIFEQAAAAAGAWDVAAMREVLLTEQFDTVCGPLGFEPSGRPRGRMGLAVWRGGDLVIKDGSGKEGKDAA